MKAHPCGSAASRVAPSTPAALSPDTSKAPSESYLPARYSGPEDGCSHPQHGRFVRVADGMLVPLMYRVRVHGGDKLPLQGPQVYCFNHPSTADPEIMHDVVSRDVRFMADINLFQGPLGPLLTWGGAFPVNRECPSPTTVHHAIEVLQQGHGLGIAPEGGCSKDPLRLDAFKRGPAYIGMKGGAENLVPMTFHYHADDGAGTRKEKLVGYGVAAAVTGLTLAAAATGVLAPVAAVLCATVAGAAAGGKGAKSLFKIKNSTVQAVNGLGVKLGGGVAGAVVAGVGTCVALAALPAAAPVLAAGGAAAAGVGLLGLARAWRHRNIAEVVIGDPIPVQPYVERYGIPVGSVKLSEDLHRSMGHSKAEVTGVPYDDTAPKMKPASVRLEEH